MNKYLRKLMSLTAIIALVLVFLTPLAPADVMAASPAVDDICKGVDIGAGGSCGQGTGSAGVERVIGLAINILTFIVGVVAVITIIVAGLKYITSVGDSNSVNSAKNTILYAVIGLVVVALAQVIVRFTLHNASKTQSGSNSSSVRYG